MKRRDFLKCAGLVVGAAAAPIALFLKSAAKGSMPLCFLPPRNGVYKVEEVLPAKLKWSRKDTGALYVTSTDRLVFDRRMRPFDDGLLMMNLRTREVFSVDLLDGSPFGVRLVLRGLGEEPKAPFLVGDEVLRLGYRAEDV